MTFLPILAWPAIAAGCLALLVAIWWSRLTARSSGGAGRLGGPVRMTVAVLALAIAALRPGVPGGVADVNVTKLNVYFVIDTTPSILAEDFGDDPRLDGVRADVVALARTYLGARFSVITFDNETRVRLPLSTDTTALEAALSTIMTERSRTSTGSSVTAAHERVAALLQQSVDRHPDRARLVFYFGDGEQTAAGPPEPFTVPSGAVNGGAVLGYGTSEGGPMRERDPFGELGRYIVDPSTAEPALSVIDESNLQAIASQLGVPYVHRAPGDDIDAVTEGISLAAIATDRVSEKEHVATRQELYWPFMVIVALLSAWELGLVLWGMRGLRRRPLSPPDGVVRT